MAFFSEKTPVLPTTIEEVADEADRTSNERRRRRIVEATFQCINLVLSCVQFIILCLFSNTRPSYDNRYSELSALLARGLYISMPIAAPMTIILFIAIPYISLPAYTRIARDLVVCCYLVSTLLGALLVGRSH